VKANRYEKPQVRDYGNVEELTAKAVAGTKLDATFPAGTPISQLTFS
jgi:hypothetical protein